ncbi:hypothetical protein [Halobacillus aidingensis]|uniref:Uncharacterized protein n=1 Tax=Halobacillus aidingensis TaxID=240303 RepID=A0A1H0MIE4_HALAD|nr:hypothetical protein [Halobacillus aidingensis]SDO80223.1 hypothetical protein SAMN05421677_10849 [Halobacillus aidingensis]
MNKSYDNGVKTYQMDEAERKKKMAINPLNYIELKEKELTDAAIAKQWGIHQPELSKKKDNWGFIGKSLDEMKKIAKKKTSKAQREKAQSHSMQDQIKEEVQEKESVKENQDSDLEKELKEANGEVQRLNSVNDDLKGDLRDERKKYSTLYKDFERKEADLEEEQEKVKLNSLKLQQITQEYESLQLKYKELEEQFDALQDQDYSPKQTVILIEKQLNEEREAHQVTKLKVEDLQREKQMLMNQNQILTNNNERFQQRYREAEKTHEALAAYTQRVMPS